MRHRRFFSLNGLAIQLSAFALSFTLVALLVVSSSKAAFVEESQSLRDYRAAAAAPGGPDRSATSATQGAPPSSTPARPLPAAPSRAEPAGPAVAEPAPSAAPVPDHAAGSSTPAAVTLTASTRGRALFSEESALVPGAALDRCIEVTYTGDAPAQPISLYAVQTGGDLAAYLDLAVDLAVPGAGAPSSCAGFTPGAALYAGTLADFAGAHATYAGGVPTWRPTGGNATRTFRFRISVRDDPAALGRSATFGFAWETRSS